MADGQCIFCRIVRGEIPCHEIYSTDTVLAFLDIAPVAAGHALIIPKAHHDTLFDLPPDTGRDLTLALQAVGKGVMDFTKAQGVNVGMNVFEAAGQLVFHAHYHLIPRYDGDGLKLWPQTPADDHEQLAKLARSIRERIA